MRSSGDFTSVSTDPKTPQQRLAERALSAGQ